MIVLGLLVLAYLLCSESPTVKESLTTEPPGNAKQFDDVTLETADRISRLRQQVENHISDAGQMVDPQPSPSDKKQRKEIIIFTAKNCPPCDRWKRCEQPKFEAAGWKVAYCEKHDFPLTPTFLIESDGKTKEKQGYFSYEQLNEVLR